MQDLKIMTVNNTNTDIRPVLTHFVNYAKTGILHEDVADLFSASIIDENGYRKVIIDFLD